MSFNLDNALHGVQEARAAVFVETGNEELALIDEIERRTRTAALEAISTGLNDLEVMIKDYGN